MSRICAPFGSGRTAHDAYMHHHMLTFTASGARLPGLALKFLLTLALHGVLLYWVLQAMPGLAVLAHTAPVPIRVALIAPPRPATVQPTTPPRALPAAAQTTKPAARPAARPMPQRMPKPAPAPLLTTDSGATAMASAPAMPAAATPDAAAASAVAATSSVAVAAPPALEPARFNADYLNNPAPAYPLMSRRQGESGKVLLLVQVTANGAAARVEIKQGSGFPRLDQAALNAVHQWRFVPARRGEAAVAASVVVPITFRLDS